MRESGNASVGTQLARILRDRIARPSRITSAGRVAR